MMTHILLLIAAPPAGPLSAEAPSAGLGVIRAAAPRSHAFSLTHAGGRDPVRITGVRTDCGCLRPRMSRRELPPGQSARLTVDIRSASRPAGPASWSVRVEYTFRGRRHELPLRLYGRVTRDVEIEPAALSLSADLDQPAVVTVTDRRGSVTPLTIRRALAADGRLSVELRKTANPAVNELLIRPNAALKPGDHRETVRIETDDADYPMLLLPVSLRAAPRAAVTARPDRVRVRLSERRRVASRLVQFRAADGKPVRIAAATCPDGRVKVQYAAGRHAVATMRVRVLRRAAGGRGSTSVRVEFAEPAGAVVAVPVRWRDE